MDVRGFPVYSIPLATLELRAKAAAAPVGKAGRGTLLFVERDLTSVVQQAHRIGFYTGECEARLALAEVESRLSSASAGPQLTAMTAEAQKRGFLLYAAEAAKMNAHSEALAINNQGQAVGHSGVSGDATVHAVLWENGAVKDLGAIRAGFYQYGFSPVQNER